MAHTTNRLVEAMRGVVSPSLQGSGAIDKLTLTLEPVIIERFYPSEYQARCILRDTYNDPEPVYLIADIMLLGLTDNIRILSIPRGEYEECSVTGLESIIPDDMIIGLVIALGGELTSKGTILIGYTNLFDNEDLPELNGEILIQNGDSFIRIEEESIHIESPQITINGVEN